MRVSGSLVLAVLLAAPSSAPASPRRLRLVEAVAEALRQNLQLQQSRAKLEESEESRRAARGGFGPSLSVDASVLVWNDKLEFAMSSPGPDVIAKHGPVLAKYADLMAALPDLFSFGAIRDQVTGQVAVTLAQPLTPLYTITKAYQAACLGAQASRLDLTAAEESTAYEVARAYIGLKQATDGVAIAKTAALQLTAHRTQAQTFARVGMIAENEVLKADLALAEARQTLIQIQAAESLAQSALALLLGRPPSEVIIPVETFADPPPRMQDGLEAFALRALQNRPELKAMGHRVEMARKGKEIARWDLVPQVALVATYTHSEGQGVFTPKNTFFAGGVLKWKLWDWGTTYYQGSAAALKVKQAQLGEQQLRDGIYLEVKKSFLDVRSADQTLEATRTSVAQAEENFRIERAKYSKNSSTTTDVLDAQLALTRAKLSHSNALHQWYVARAALSKATGGAGAREISR